MNYPLLILGKVIEGWWFVALHKVSYWVKIYQRHRGTQKQNHCLYKNSLIKQITLIIRIRTTLHRGFYARLWVSIHASSNLFSSPVRMKIYATHRFMLRFNLWLKPPLRSQDQSNSLRSKGACSDFPIGHFWTHTGS